MDLFSLLVLALSVALSSASTIPNHGHNHFNVRPFHIDLESRVPRMLELAKNTRLPQSPLYPGLGTSAGISTKVLNDLRTQWVTDFDWSKEQKEMNQFHHFTVEIEGQTIHYIHQRSNDPDAIPLMLIHGWPGSFLEFVPVMKPLTQQAKTSSGKPVSFHVVVPSLPGFAFASSAPANWTTDDTARIYNMLMTKALGYDKFAVFGTDWGVAPAYTLYANFTQTCRALHAAFLPFYPPTTEQIEAANITLSPLEQFEHDRAMQWSAAGNGYFVEQTTEPNTLGLALQDSPIGQLSWIGGKFIQCITPVSHPLHPSNKPTLGSDPLAGTPPSVITPNEILRSVSLYYLTSTFLSSIFIYFQNPGGFRTIYTKAETDAPMLFSVFKWNVGFWPREFVERVGNLVMYSNHEFGGHFPGIDNPPALIGDLREIGDFWEG